MKEYTMVVVDLVTGLSTALPGVKNGDGIWPDFNIRSRDDQPTAFQELVRSQDLPTKAPAEFRWRPVNIVPMGTAGITTLGKTEMSVNPTVLVLMERDVWLGDE